MPNGPQGSISQPNQRYTKAECIGRGASKVVYKAFDVVEGIEVAWNEVVCSDACLGSGKERSRMLGEITMLRQLKHRNIMRLYDWWYDKQQQVLVFITELLTDGSLRRFIRRKHAAGITLSVLKRYAWQILQGLVYLHGHYPPIIHRDLKCDNIFVNGASGELKLGDLGFATLLRGISCPLSVIGTPEFMAPELYDEHYDEKVDIYSYGMCLLELATLEYPYNECSNPAQIYRKVSKGMPPAGLAKVVNAALREFISLTINPDPKQRPEARQLLVHPFFADVVQAIRAKGWARGPAPALGAAAAAAAAGPRVAAGAAAGATANDMVIGPATLATAGTGRVPLSAPDGLAAITAAVDAVVAAGGSRDSNTHSQQPHLNTTSAPLPAAAAAMCDSQVPFVHGSLLPAVDAVQPVPGSVRLGPGASCGPVIMQAALSQELLQQHDLQQQQQRDQAAFSNHSKSEGQMSSPSLPKQQQQQEVQQIQQQRRQRSSLDTSFTSTVSESGSYPDIHTSSISWPVSLTINTGAAAAAATDGAARLRISSSLTHTSTPTQSPFAAASRNSITGSSAGSWTGGTTCLGSAAAAGGGGGGSLGVPGVHVRSRGHAPSLDEMSEEDVLFDAADSQSTHTDDLDSEHDHYDGASPAHQQQQQQQQQQHLHDIWKSMQHGPQQQQQQHKLDPIREDNDGEDDVECMCRQIDQQQLSFNVGFFNTTGMRKRVGFQYNANEDTVDDIAMEMLENLSLMPQQATAIAEKIKAALEALGLPHNRATTPAAAGGSSSSNGHASLPHTQLAGESVALAIVSTAAASAAIDSCGTPGPGSADGGSPAAAAAASASATSDGSSGPLGICQPTGYGFGHAPQGITNADKADDELLLDHTSTVVVCSGGITPEGGVQQSCALSGGAAAAAASEAGSNALNPQQQQQQLGAVCAQQLVRELSMLDREAGTALLQNLQEELLVQSLAMPEAAAAAGVELGVTLTGPNGHQIE